MRAGVVVLMYHRLGVGVLPGRELGEEAYAVAPADFELQLQVLADSRCAVVPLDGMAGPRGAIPARAVAISFDDGNLSDHAVALPALRRRGWPATFFVTPAWVGTPGYLGWPELRELAAAGMCVGAHGLDHTLLSTLDAGRLRRHLSEARRLLEAELGRPVELLSLPGGAGGAEVVAVANEVGFRVVAGSEPALLEPGSAGALPRHALRRGDSIEGFRALVEQRRLALWRASARHRTLGWLRSAVGPTLYQRARRVWVGSA